jgi:hypothetical protein
MSDLEGCLENVWFRGMFWICLVNVRGLSRKIPVKGSLGFRGMS